MKINELNVKLQELLEAFIGLMQLAYEEVDYYTNDLGYYWFHHQVSVSTGGLHTTVISIWVNGDNNRYELNFRGLHYSIENKIFFDPVELCDYLHQLMEWDEDNSYNGDKLK